MLNLKELYNGTRKLRDKINPTNSFEITKVVGLPFLRVLAVQARYQPYTEKDKAYHEVSLLFHDIAFAQERRDNFVFECDVVPGIRAYAQKPSFETSRVQVRCTCSDYYFTWWLSNRHFASNAGPDMELYTRITPPPPKGYPYRNPLNTPGCCKHIMRFSRYLVSKGLVTYP